MTRLCLLISLLFVASFAYAASPRLNVLLIAVDDLRPELGCYGVQAVHTPHMDRLAARGMRFDLAYCQFPLCGPSRASMLTGRHPATTGVLNHSFGFRKLHPDWVSLPQHFKQNGYHSAATGKIYHGSLDDPESWHEVIKAALPRDRKPPPDPPGAKDENLSEYERDQIISDRIVRLTGDGEDHTDYYVAMNGVDLLTRHRERRFFIATGFQKPHSPPTAPERFFDLVKPADLTLPPDLHPSPTVPAGFPKDCLPSDNGDLFMRRDATPEKALEIIHAYCVSVAWTDWNIGRMLDALERNGLVGNTIVILFGDHGYHLGEKGKWSKHGSLFDVSLRVPLIICGPEIRSGVCSRPVQLVDLYPTLIELCGLPAMPGLEGHSLVPLLRDPVANWPHAALSVCKRAGRLHHSIRTNHWRYTETNEGSLLFDHRNDPNEMRNLAQDPAHAETVQELQKLLPRSPL